MAIVAIDDRRDVAATMEAKIASVNSKLESIE